MLSKLLEKAPWALESAEYTTFCGDGIFSMLKSIILRLFGRKVFHSHILFFIHEYAGFIKTPHSDHAHKAHYYG